MFVRLHVLTPIPTGMWGMCGGEHHPQKQCVSNDGGLAEGSCGCHMPQSGLHDIVSDTALDRYT